MRYSFAMKRSLCLLFAYAVSMQAASISLDTAGADPDLTTPSFTFQTDANGSFSAIYRNVSNPPMDFTSLELIAPFTSDFYNGPGGPKSGSTCDGRNAFMTCSITFEDNLYTVVFDFYGIDATHRGLPSQGSVGLIARAFQPNQMVGASGTSQPSGIPEPGSFGLALTGILLAGLAVSRNKLLKLRVRV